MARIQIVYIIAMIQVLAALAQNCGPTASNTVCSDAGCCSGRGWCGHTKDHCDLKTCLKDFSDPRSICGSTTNGSNTDSSSRSSSFASRLQMSLFGIGHRHSMDVPDIDQCGPSVQFSCPGAGAKGYFYRCCSSDGHCGPKNDLQKQDIYCGKGCQSEFGDCGSRKKPSRPRATPKIVGSGAKCGPIVNARCAPGLCCSGSNFCGTGEDYCGDANWCQPEYSGTCNGSRK